MPKEIMEEENKENLKFDQKISTPMEIIPEITDNPRAIDMFIPDSEEEEEDRPKTRNFNIELPKPKTSKGKRLRSKSKSAKSKHLVNFTIKKY